MSDDTRARPEAIRGLLENYLRCPTSTILADLEAALRLYQTEWITAHAGGAVPAADGDGKRVTAAPASRPMRLAAADQVVLERMADGWLPTTAEVTRWAWFEDRGLVSIDKGPVGSDRADRECLYLTDDGLRALGRPASRHPG